MPFQIIRNDITKVKADAIVNTANPGVAVGRGTDCAVYHAAGRDRLLAERKKIGIMHPGQNKTSVILGAPLFPDVSGMSLDEILESSEDTFQQKLFKLIEESGMDDVTVYKKANINRKVFSRIRCKKDYKRIISRRKKQRWLLQSRFSWICRRCWICCPGQGLHSLPAASLT